MLGGMGNRGELFVFLELFNKRDWTKLSFLLRRVNIEESMGSCYRERNRLGAIL